jgi:hypothetical protein
VGNNRFYINIEVRRKKEIHMKLLSTIIIISMILAYSNVYSQDEEKDLIIVYGPCSSAYQNYGAQACYSVFDPEVQSIVTWKEFPDGYLDEITNDNMPLYIEHTDNLADTLPASIKPMLYSEATADRVEVVDTLPEGCPDGFDRCKKIIQTGNSIELVQYELPGAAADGESPFGVTDTITFSSSAAPYGATLTDNIVPYGVTMTFAANPYRKGKEIVPYGESAKRVPYGVTRGRVFDDELNESLESLADVATAIGAFQLGRASACLKRLGFTAYDYMIPDRRKELSECIKFKFAGDEAIELDLVE